jgi:hypothetical protein
VGRTDDPAEHAADRAADTVMSMPAAGGTLRRKCSCGGEAGPDGECATCRARKLELRRLSAGPAPGTRSAPPEVHQTLAAPGRPLDAGTRAFMEPRFGHSFANVRVHDDGAAARSARAVGALAYTVGRDVVFGTGRYAPGTADGRRLLAHELAHVVQQAPSPGATLQREADPAEDTGETARAEPAETPVDESTGGEAEDQAVEQKGGAACRGTRAANSPASGIVNYMNHPFNVGRGCSQARVTLTASWAHLGCEDPGSFSIQLDGAGPRHPMMASFTSGGCGPVRRSPPQVHTYVSIPRGAHFIRVHGAGPGTLLQYSGTIRVS